ncbi:unnamed protein product [Meloidogyne enterolobii]|uniref:Uncharacterized protein n=1 Tax=Meloidogyne enterolobii TaxID=390850 RepID=A0ACB1A733_MELEN
MTDFKRLFAHSSLNKFRIKYIYCAMMNEVLPGLYVGGLRLS